MFNHRKKILVVVTALTLLSLPGLSRAATVEDAHRDYEWVDLSTCKKPGKALRALPKESYRTYNAQRRYLDLDNNGVCEVMDFWVERLGDDPSPGMRSLEHRFYRYKDGRWQPFETDLNFYPYAIRLRQTNHIVFVEAADGDDIGDDMAALSMSIPSVVLSNYLNHMIRCLSYSHLFCGANDESGHADHADR
jgi:hypothetical protein